MQSGTVYWTPTPMQFGAPPAMDVPGLVIQNFFGIVSTIILFLLPMLTMGIYAEERKRGTMELLMTSPIHDVEIIIDKVPDAIHVPTQAVFEKDGKQFVYVQNLTDNRFEARVIKLAKRSESVMIIAEGLKPNEIVALNDPTAKKNNKNDKSSSSPKSLGMPSSGAAAGKGN
jgi:hypothetical protein